MANKTGHQMAQELSDFVNANSFELQQFAETVTTEHRYLQGEMFTGMLKCIERWAKYGEQGYFDPRNEYACKASKAMLEGLKQAGLY